MKKQVLYYQLTRDEVAERYSHLPTGLHFPYGAFYTSNITPDMIGHMMNTMHRQLEHCLIVYREDAHSFDLVSSNEQAIIGCLDYLGVPYHNEAIVAAINKRGWPPAAITRLVDRLRSESDGIDDRSLYQLARNEFHKGGANVDA